MSSWSPTAASSTPSSSPAASRSAASRTWAGDGWRPPTDTCAPATAYSSATKPTAPAAPSPASSDPHLGVRCVFGAPVGLDPAHLGGGRGAVAVLVEDAAERASGVELAQ